MENVQFRAHISLGNILSLCGVVSSLAIMLWQLGGYTANINNKFDNLSGDIKRNQASIAALEERYSAENEKLISLQVELSDLRMFVLKEGKRK